MTDRDLVPDPQAPAIDETELANALAPLTADPEAFRDGVDARIAAARPQPADAAAPTWLRRAASFAPIGLPDLALVGGGSGAKPLSFAGLIVAPWAMLALGVCAFVGMLAATLRLSASNSGEHAAAQRGAPGFGAWAAAGALPVGIAIAALLSHDSTWLFGAFLVGGAVIVAATRSLSRAGLADRGRVGAYALACLFVVVVLAALVVFGHRDATSACTLAMLPVLAITTFVIGRSSHNERLAHVLLITIAFYAWLSWSSINLTPMSRAELVQWCEQFEGDANRHGSWATIGDARRALGEPELDLSRAARQLEAFDPPTAAVRWHVGANAWRAGLSTPALFEQLRLPDSYLQDLRAAPQLLHGTEAVGFAAAIARDELGDADRAAAWRSVEHTMHEAVARPSIRLALAAIEAAAALGDDRYAERHRDGIHTILTRSFTPDGRERGGFGEWLGARHDRLFTMFDYTRNGVELMSYVGAPADLDAYAVDRYLTRQLSRLPDQRGVAQAMTRVHLRRFCNVAPAAPALLVFVRENLALLTVILLCGLSLWVVWRAPKRAPIEVGPLADARPDRDGARIA
ncbi:MAG: hypothetical protein KAI24_21640 [Planctomycetes bacterium]|nr:hypothetical protein [Planctomycetota bacterium]